MTNYSLPAPLDISRILEREQEAARLKLKYSMRPRVVAKEELAATSREDREGAGILRSLIDRMDPVMWDDHVVIIRMVLPAEIMMQLELWGSENQDMEEAHDLEQWLFEGTK